MSKNNLEEIIWEGVFQNFEDTQSDTQVFNSDLSPDNLSKGLSDLCPFVE